MLRLVSDARSRAPKALAPIPPGGSPEARMIDHLSTYATGYAETKAFYEAALSPLGYGLQHDMVEHYFAAFVLDPDGNDVEAVCHSPAP
jgi:hypothetical protein